MTRYFRRLAAALGLLGGLLHAQTSSKEIEAELQRQFAGHIAVLRNFYSGPKLHFDSSGHPQGSPKTAFGPIDSNLHIVKVRFDGRQLALEGDTGVPVWDAVSDRVTWHTIPWKRSIIIDAPDVHDLPSAINLLYSAIYRANEPMTPSCTDEERARFANAVKNGIGATYTVSAKKQEESARVPVPVDQVPRMCFPTGESAYTAAPGVVHPKPKHTPDPSYTNTGVMARLTGLVDLMFIVDESGRVNSVIMVGKPLGAGLDEQTLKTMQSWRFEPATLAAKPIRSPLFVEFHFDLRR
jgi:TonB family protein